MTKAEAGLPEAIWQLAADAVESGRMPPPTPTSRFPLDPQQRSALVEALFRTAMGDSRDRSTEDRPRLAMLDMQQWAAMMHEVADPFVGPTKVAGVLRQYRGGNGGLFQRADDEEPPTGRDLFPLGQMNRTLAAEEICRLVIESERARAAGARRLFVGSALDERISSASSASLAQKTFALVHLAEPTATQAERGRTFLEESTAHGSSTTEGVAALCAAYASGPHLVFLPLREAKK